MGFRDIEAFNLAMLAKQCWRLIQNTTPYSIEYINPGTSQHALLWRQNWATIRHTFGEVCWLQGR